VARVEEEDDSFQGLFIAGGVNGYTSVNNVRLNEVVKEIGPHAVSSGREGLILLISIRISIGAIRKPVARKINQS
jgi:hypothetical protein